MHIVEVDSATPETERALLIGRSEGLHRQLRPRLPVTYHDHLEDMLREGARLTILFEEEEPHSLAVWRTHLSTYAGRRFYVDDLVTDEHARSRGLGGKLLSWLEGRARELGCDTFALDSGVQRGAAHRFYFRSGLAISSFGFAKSLNDRF
jgi:GNAT superfamily N-acetyltransferase